MKASAFAVAAVFVVGAFAQVKSNSDASYTCPSKGGNYCAGKSGSTNIIIRCEGTVGHASNCDDNLAGEPPLGVSYAPCVEASPRSGDASCAKNGIVYPDAPSPYKSTPPVYTPTGGKPGTTPTATPPYPIIYPHGSNSTTTKTIAPPPQHTSIIVPPPSSSEPSATTYTTSITMYVTAATTLTITESNCAASTPVSASGPTGITESSSSVAATVIPSTHSTHTTLTITSTSTSTFSSTLSFHTHTILPSGGHGGHGNHTAPTWKLAPPQDPPAPTAPEHHHRAVRRSVPEDHAPASYKGAAGSLSGKAASMGGAATVILAAIVMVAA